MTTPSIEQQARALMSTWVEQQGPSEEVRSRTWEAVSARASAGELGPELEPEPSVPAPTPKLAPLRLILGSLSVVAVIVGVGWMLTKPNAELAAAVTLASEPSEPSLASEPSEPSLASEPVEGPPGAAERPPDSAPMLAPTLAPTRPATFIEPEPSVNPRRGTASVAKSPAKLDAEAQAEDSIDPLALEMQLLGAARTALKSGDIEAALAALDDHAKRFPKGALRAERELSRITALCKAGRLDDAEATARRYIDAHPGSTQAKRLADTCIGERL